MVVVSAALRSAALGVSCARLAADTLVVRPAGHTLAAERRLRARAGRELSEATVALVDRLAEQLLAGDALDRLLDRADRAGVPQRIAERMLDDGVVEELATRLLAGPELERILVAALESEAVRNGVASALDSPGAERLVVVALESPGVERMVRLIVESRVVDETVARVMEEVAARLPQSDAMWTLVDEIAQSPAVSEAITQQGAGFADQVADEVREHSRNVDDRLERAAWRLLRRRRARGIGPGGSPSTSGAT